MGCLITDALLVLAILFLESTSQEQADLSKICGGTKIINVHFTQNEVDILLDLLAAINEKPENFDLFEFLNEKDSRWVLDSIAEITGELKKYSA